MTDREIFNELFRIAKSAKLNHGAVSACLVRNGEVLAITTSSDSPNRHAEDLLLEKIEKENIPLQKEDILYVTIEPCGERTRGGGGEQFGDCATKIINSKVKKIVYAVPDPHYSQKVAERFGVAGVSSCQVDDENIVNVARQIFNETVLDQEYLKQKGGRSFL